MDTGSFPGVKSGRDICHWMPLTVTKITRRSWCENEYGGMMKSYWWGKPEVLEQRRAPVSLYPVQISYGLDCNGTAGPAAGLFCVGPSDRTVPTAAAAVRVSYVCSVGTPHWVCRTDWSWPQVLVEDIPLCLKLNDRTNLYMYSV